MKNELAIEILKELWRYEHTDKYTETETREALDMAITALSADGDLISRKDTIEWLKKVTVTDGITFETGFKQILVDIEQMPSAEKTTNKININEYVKVKLTDYGKEIFYHQYDNLNKTYGKEIIKPSYPTVDSDGYTSFQLWYFMNLYGRYIDMGVQNVIEPLEIVFESAEKTAEWVHTNETATRCPICGYRNYAELFPYCPNCGATMRKESEEEE